MKISWLFAEHQPTLMRVPSPQSKSDISDFDNCMRRLGNSRVRRERGKRRIPRHRRCAADGVRDGGARAKALRGEPADEVAAEGGFAAEQMRAAGDVEDQAVGCIEPDQRRVAVAPVGDGVEQGWSASGSASATAIAG